MSTIRHSLREKIEPLIKDEGLEMVEFKFSGTGHSCILRVFVDKAGGVSVEQCASLSRKLGDFLDTEDIIPGKYTLEISSPGLDRPLVESADFKRKVGEKVRVFLNEAVSGKREMEGKIKHLSEENLVLEESSASGQNGKECIIPLKKINKAKIIF
jgi:ribosome maturation factor RimP